jgi:hypothetical protein
MPPLPPPPPPPPPLPPPDVPDAEKATLPRPIPLPMERKLLVQGAAAARRLLQQSHPRARLWLRQTLQRKLRQRGRPRAAAGARRRACERAAHLPLTPTPTSPRTHTPFQFQFFAVGRQVCKVNRAQRRLFLLPPFRRAGDVRGLLSHCLGHFIRAAATVLLPRLQHAVTPCTARLQSRH